MTQKNKKQFNLSRYFQKTIIVLMVMIVFFGWEINLGKVHFFTSVYSETVDDEKKDDKEKIEEEVKKKEKELKKLKKAKKKNEKIKESYIREANIIKRDINNLVGDIKTIETKVSRTEEELKALNKELEDIENSAMIHKKSLAKILQEINQVDLDLQITVLDESKGIEEYIYNKNILENLQKKMEVALAKLKDQEEKLNEKKKEISETHEVLNDQQKTLEKEKKKKSWLYNGTQRKISEKDAEIRQLEQEMAMLNAAISGLLGKNYNTADIKEAAAYAGKLTGVRTAFILGMLTVETNLGRYTGGCTYKTSRMSNYRKKLFKKICKETGHNYKKMKVSCPPSNYKGTGGAMGVAQFMSDTWIAYSPQIAKITGHKHPDPWNLTDGVVAMALKLANDGATSKKGECRAAMRYLGGSHKWYCEKVLNYARQYEK